MRVLVTDPIASDGLDILREQLSAVVHAGLTEDELVKEIGGYDALIVRIKRSSSKKPTRLTFVRPSFSIMPTISFFAGPSPAIISFALLRSFFIA